MHTYMHTRTHTDRGWQASYFARSEETWEASAHAPVRKRRVVVLLLLDLCPDNADDAVEQRGAVCLERAPVDAAAEDDDRGQWPALVEAQRPGDGGQQAVLLRLALLLSVAGKVPNTRAVKSNKGCMLERRDPLPQKHDMAHVHLVSKQASYQVSASHLQQCLLPCLQLACLELQLALLFPGGADCAWCSGGAPAGTDSSAQDPMVPSNWGAQHAQHTAQPTSPGKRCVQPPAHIAIQPEERCTKITTKLTLAPPRPRVCGGMASLGARGPGERTPCPRTLRGPGPGRAA